MELQATEEAERSRWTEQDTLGLSHRRDGEVNYSSLLTNTHSRKLYM